MKILIDTREQCPFTFSGFDVQVERATLGTGDYSLPGFEDRVAVERKELDDLIACMMGKNRERFEKELARLRAYDFAAVVCEGGWADLSGGRYRSEIKPQSVLQSIAAFMVRYRLPFLMAGSRRAAEYLTHSLLAKYLYEIDQRHKRATKAQAA